MVTLNNAMANLNDANSLNSTNLTYSDTNTMMSLNNNMYDVNKAIMTLNNQLNNAASESMFADTQLYENITRLCNFIGYHPRAYTPATLDFYLNNSFEGMNKTIMKCTAFYTGLKDSNGNDIYFSKLYDNDIEYEKVEYTSFQMTNGRWKVYPTRLEANGVDYETFVLNIQSDSNSEKYVADGCIKVFVITDGGSTIDTEWEYDPNELFIQSFQQKNSK